MFKITALMTFFAILFYYALEKIKFLNPQNKTFTKHNNIFIIGAFLVISIIGSWIYYASSFNKCHDCGYFSTRTFPIWDMDYTAIKDLINQVINYWFVDYFHQSVHILFVIMSIFLLCNIKKITWAYGTILIALIIQSIAYILLQFWTLYNHDYYIVNQYIVPIFIGIIFFDIAVKNYIKFLRNIYIKIIFSLFILFNIFYANDRVAERYTSWKNDFKKINEDIYSITPYLREKGIAFSDKVIYFSDRSNVSLYLMNQFGWTQYANPNLYGDKSVKYNWDSIGICKLINLGAKYLIINNIDILYEYPYLQSFAANLVGNYKDVLIFDLKHKNSSNLVNLNTKLIDTVICDAEQVSDGMYLTSNKAFLLENGNTQTDKKAFKGKYSSMLSKNNPYGMTIKIYDCKPRESFHVTAWRNGDPKASIVASGPKETNFYVTGANVIEKDTINLWEKIELNFSVPKEMVDKELKIFLCNSDTVYFDNFIIERYNKYILSKK